MSWLGDQKAFEVFNFKNMLHKLGHDPERAVFGIPYDKYGTQIYNKVLGTHYDPVVNEGGGPTNQEYDEAKRAGINVGPARGTHKVADTIAEIWGLAGAFGAMGGGSAGGAAAGAGEGAGAGAGAGAAAGDAMGGSAGTLGAADSAASGISFESVVPSSVNVTNGGGIMSTGFGGASSMTRQMPRMPQQQQQQDDQVDQSNVQVSEPDLAAYYATSSKSKKVRATMDVHGAIDRGATGQDPISQNGVHIAAIQALTKRIEAARKELKQLEGSHEHR